MILSQKLTKDQLWCLNKSRPNNRLDSKIVNFLIKVVKLVNSRAITLADKANFS